MVKKLCFGMTSPAKCVTQINRVLFFHLFSLDAFEAFSYMTALHGLQDHPGIKAIMVIGSLVAEATCDEKLDGLYYSLWFLTY